MDLTHQQRIYLQMVFDHFRKKGSWPTYNNLERQVFQTHLNLNLEDIVNSLPDGMASSFNPDSEATLTIPAIYECSNTQEDLSFFVQVVRFCADKYIYSEESKPEVSDFDIWRHFGGTRESIYRFGLLLRDEPGICTYFTINPYVNSWVCTLSRELLYYKEVMSIEQYLERRENLTNIKNQPTLAEQLRNLIGCVYCKPTRPTTKDIQTGIATWMQYLSVPSEDGSKLEVALLNALARVDVPMLFGGDARQGGTNTPAYDLIALNVRQTTPIAVLISCKSTDRQPNRTSINLLSDISHRLTDLVPGWLVFGVMVNLGEPTSDEFNYRQDIRIWKQSHLQAILNARERKYLEMLLWTPPQQWTHEVEVTWKNAYDSYHKM